ncbi:MAG: MBOAT family O-acyltransferase [Desulfobacterales bacterium]|nr:MBOAT family O-acyltransferase [Desulfobacterales bacterium]
MALLVHSILYFPVQSRPSYKILNLSIFLASIIFYGWGEPKYILILLFSTLCNFFLAILIESSTSQGRRNGFLTTGILINLLMLAYYKYAGFFADLLHQMTGDLFSSQGVSLEFMRGIILPIGISFFTFQGLSYLIDVHRKIVKPSYRFTDFACYLTMFSQLIAGPIVRYTAIETQLNTRTLSIGRMWKGATRFVFGLAKKVLIADTLGRIADAAFNVSSGELSASAAWLGIICYFFQIYYDFSGYSDMAIGIGQMMGFQFPENFNYPYISKSIREFWRRWHMTLSSWFRDYLYIPLGGNRKGKYRTVFNLFLVFALCGLWHGASLSFLIWGMYHGIFICLERFFPKFTNRLPSFFLHAYTTMVILIGWVFFRAEDLDAAGDYLKAMLWGATKQSYESNEVWLLANGYVLPITLLAAFVLSTPVFQHLHRKFKNYCLNGKPVPVILLLLGRNCWVLILFFLCLMPLYGATYNAFIYFRF